MSVVHSYLTTGNMFLSNQFLLSAQTNFSGFIFCVYLVSSIGAGEMKDLGGQKDYFYGKLSSLEC